MKLTKVEIRNFRRLESVSIDVEDNETIFVGPNNSGKTSATAAFRCFLGGREFKIHDFAVGRTEDFEKFVDSGDATDLPTIDLDLWFSIDPKSIAFARVFSLLPQLKDFTRVGVRLTYRISDPKKLREQYSTAYPKNQKGKRSRSIIHFLGADNNLSRLSEVVYASLEEKKADDNTVSVVATALDPEEGRRVVKNLVRVDFVDAQRNINDDDSSRSNRLSSAFAAYYKKNLEQADHAAEAHKVIDANNANLTDHYKTQFKPLIDLIKGLGVPSVNDRDLRIISSLSPEMALRGSTELLYVDAGRNHELPELYNGLGFKNLIYMAIQARHYHSQWLATSDARPLCMVLFIEEPEVHLHAQVQQTFISNIWSVINESAKEEDKNLVPQIVMTTHSSHILEAVDFEKIRYFQRRHPEGSTTGVRSLTEVVSLRAFQPEADVADGNVMSPEESLQFLKRYIRLTHCDLFFADAAILVEGAVEKLLMSSMIQASAQRLQTTYLTTLEVGGAFAHRFEGLLSFLRIPYLVITDLDSVSPEGYPTVCRADVVGARTSNASLKKLLGKERVDDLIKMSIKDKTSVKFDRCVVFETDTVVSHGESKLSMRARTIEEAIAYSNYDLVRAKTIPLGIDIPDQLEAAYQAIYDRVKADSFKKTDFAMTLLAAAEGWTVPAYIDEGLKWLEARLCDQPAPTEPPVDPPIEGDAQEGDQHG